MECAAPKQRLKWLSTGKGKLRMQIGKSEFNSNWKPILSILCPLGLTVMGVDAYLRASHTLELEIMEFSTPIFFALLLGFNNKIDFKTEELEYKTYFYWKQLKNRIIPFNDIEKVWVQMNPIFKSRILAFGVVQKGKEFKIMAGKFKNEESILRILEERSGLKRNLIEVKKWTRK